MSAARKRIVAVQTVASRAISGKLLEEATA